ncbi:MAG: hypothetical protein COA78_04180 [Blastopirellula sp.]|nr:MAG: hypothetical protein COA78_04180 [Blastopirellula sp.]
MNHLIQLKQAQRAALLSCCGVLFFIGCSSTPSRKVLLDSKDSGLSLLQHVSLGSDVATVEEFMINKGFDTSYEEDATFYDETVLENGSRMKTKYEHVDLLHCNNRVPYDFSEGGLCIMGPDYTLSVVFEIRDGCVVNYFTKSVPEVT